jgi:hypothetical protein
MKMHDLRTLCAHIARYAWARMSRCWYDDAEQHYIRKILGWQGTFHRLRRQIQMSINKGGFNMKGSIWKAVGIVTALCLLSVTAVAAGGPDLAAVRQITSQYHRVEVAQAAGYAAFEDCLAEPGIGGMGFHYVNFATVDLTVDALHPEAMVYKPGPQGQLQLGAVEYIVPAAAWDAAGNTQPPSLFGQPFLFDSDFGTYELHIWLWQSNPLGLFAPWNPRVTCP